jgi:hypothetical protein
MKPYRASAARATGTGRRSQNCVYLRRNSGPEITITAVAHAPGDPRPTTVIPA